MNPFSAYIISFLGVIIVYLLGWSDIYPIISWQLVLFLLCTFVISYYLNKKLPKNFMKYKKVKYCSLVKYSLTSIFLGFAMDFLYAKQIPLFGSAEKYLEFNGIPVIHVILYTFTIFISIYLFQIFIDKRDKKNFFLWIITFLPAILLVSRGMIMNILIGSFLVLMNKIGRNFDFYKKYFIQIIIGILASMYIFGMSGNLRNNSINNYEDKLSSLYIMEVGGADNKFRESIIPKAFFWPYLYITSPLANLQLNIDKYQTNITGENFKKFLLKELTPDFISKRIVSDEEVRLENTRLLVSPSLIAGTFYTGAYNYLGWIGMAIIFLVLILCAYIYITLISFNNPFRIVAIAMLSNIIILCTFDNMISFSGMSFQLIYPLIWEGYSFVKERYFKVGVNSLGMCNMKKKLVDIIKYILYPRYNYYKFKIKGLGNKKININKNNNYINEEILLVSVDNPNGGISVGGKHIHLHLLEEGLKENNVSNYLLACEESNLYKYKIKEVASFFNLRESEFKKLEDIYFAFLTYDWIEQLKDGTKAILENNNCVKAINCHDIISTIAISQIIKELDIKLPIITTLHGYFSNENVDYGGLIPNGYLYKFFRELEKEAYNLSDRIIAVDTRIKNYVLEECPEKKDNHIIVIKNAINDVKFKPTSEDVRQELMKKYKLDKNILFVPRRLVPKNGIGFVAESINELVKRDIGDFKLVIAGDGIQRPIIEEYINNNNLESYIELLGDVTHDKIVDYFNLSKIVIVPSVPSNNVEEATSLAALEGMACGKVTIATSIGGLKELITNGENGFLVEAKDVKDMADRIEESLCMSDKEYNEVAENARKTVVENHGYIKHSLEFYEVFKQVMR